MAKWLTSVPFTLAAVIIGARAMLKRRRLSRASERARRDGRSLWILNQYSYTPEMPESIRHWELADILNQRGWTSRVFASAFNHRMRRYDRPVRVSHPVHDANEQGVEFTWIYATPYSRNDWRRYLNMASFSIVCGLDGLRRNPGPDVVIGTSPHLLTGLAAWIVSRWHRVPFVLEIQDLWPDTLIDMGLTNPIVIKPLQLLELFLYRQADAVVTLAEGISSGVVRRGATPDKVVMIPNARTDTAGQLRETRAQVRRRLGWEGKIVAIYAGSHGPANGLENVVDAALRQQRSHAVHYVLLGDGSEKPDLIKRAAGSEHLQFLDPVAKSDVHTILCGADIGLINLRWNKTFEGVRPNKIFDYLAAGLTIVTTVPGEVWEIVGAANAGILAEPENPDALADAVERLAQDNELRVQLAANGERYLRSLPTREDTALELERLLHELKVGAAERCRSGAPA